MFSHKKFIHPLLFALISIVTILAIQSIWLFHAYRLTYNQFISEINEAFVQARSKEQTYRVPVDNIINPGDVTIQGCGNEEIRIIRQCPSPDTIIYNNVSGRSLETFINNAFSDLREHIVPMNIYCLADLFAGALHDKDISVSFVIQRFDKTTGEVHETSLLSGDKHAKVKATHVIVADISDKEALRANLQFTPMAVFSRMASTLILTACLVVIALLSVICLFYSYRHKKQKDNPVSENNDTLPLTQSGIFRIGKYCFDPNKNELQGFGESIQLNKKENAILHTLCAQQGNVVERNVLLEENWGNDGLIYSRSLDTYITMLRKYLKDDPSVQIITIKGLGYKLVS